VFVATSKDLESVGGMYFNHCWVCEPIQLLQSEEFCEAVYKLGENVISSKMGQNAFVIQTWQEYDRGMN